MDPYLDLGVFLSHGAKIIIDHNVIGELAGMFC